MTEMRLALAKKLMDRFAERTGLTSDRPRRRYLWTDAFAVCNFLALERASGEQHFRELALQLVQQVHHTLGRHRADDDRRGWISGLSESAGELHPTCGGLRIGKPERERGAREPFDEQREWDRDGQYFHYLTKWIHALDRVARATDHALFSTWARELALAAHRGFTYASTRGGTKRMVWKASVDLSRPLVSSMGHHDPLDGLATCLELQATERETGVEASAELETARADFASMIEPDQLATTDPLGLGGLLVDAERIDRVASDSDAQALVRAMLAASEAGLERFVAQSDLTLPPQRRLAFRELGLAIGLAALAPMKERAAHRTESTRRRLVGLSRFEHVAAEIETFWLEPRHRASSSWLAHEDIDDVMLASVLLPDAITG